MFRSSRVRNLTRSPGNRGDDHRPQAGLKLMTEHALQSCGHALARSVLRLAFGHHAA
jgi:hypothetical protein